MKIEFFLPLEPFSINRMYYRDKRHKTQAYRDWELSFFKCLQDADIQEKLDKLRKENPEGTKCFEVCFAFHCPKLLNKQGTISSHVEDLSNVEKVLLDVLFLPKFHVQPFPYGCKNVNTDDKYVLRLVSEKSLSNQIGISVCIGHMDGPTNPE